MPQRSYVAVKMINAAIRKLDMADVRARLEAPDRRDDDPGVFVCEATKEQWFHYVRSDASQALKSRVMEWRVFQDDEGAEVSRGRVYIVELSGLLHGGLVSTLNTAFTRATGTFDDHLIAALAAHLENDNMEPDLSYGPSRNIGAARPATVPWREFHTLKVEIGVYQTWTGLRRKAEHWSTIPGVAYVLLIRVTPSMQSCQYTLYEVNPPGGGIVAMAPVPGGQERAAIDGETNVIPPTTIQLDAHRLLALPAHTPIPAGFSSPVVIDLSEIVQRVIHRMTV